MFAIRLVSVALLGLMLFSALGGCLDAAPTPPSGGPNSSASEGYEPVTNCPPDAPGCEPGGNSSAKSLKVLGADCRIIEGVIYTTPSVFAPTYPAGVQGFNGLLVSVSLSMVECVQATFANQTAPGFQLASFVTLINPPKGSDSSISNGFVHQAYTNSAPFASLAEAMHDQKFDVIATVNITLTPNPVHAKAISFEIPPGRADYAFTGMVDVQGSDPRSEKRAIVFPTAGGFGFSRLAYEGNGSSAGPGLVEFGTQSYWHSRSAAPSYPTFINFLTKATVTLEFRET